MVVQCTEKTYRFLLPFWRKVPPDPPARIDHAGPQRLLQWGILQSATLTNRRIPSRIIQIQQPRRCRFVNGIDPVFLFQRMTAGVVLVGNRRPPRHPDRRRLVIQRDRRIGQEIKQRFKPVMEKPQPMFDARMFAPGTDRLVQRIIRACRTEFDPVILPEPGHRRLVQDHFGHRGKFDQGQLFGRPLGGRIKPPRPVQHVAKEIEPDRLCLPRRKNVDDPAAQRVIAGLHHRRALGKSHAGQKSAQLPDIDPVTDPGCKRGIAQQLPRRHPLRCGIQGGQQDELRRHDMHQSRQRRHPRGRYFGVWRHTVIGQAIPAGKAEHRQARREKRQRGLHRRQALVIAGNVQHRAVPGQFGQDQLCVKAFGGAADGYMRRGQKPGTTARF